MMDASPPVSPGFLQVPTTPRGFRRSVSEDCMVRLGHILEAGHLLEYESTTDAEVWMSIVMVVMVVVVVLVVIIMLLVYYNGETVVTHV